MENRDARLLWHTKGYAPKIVMRPPETHEGSNGDIAMGTLPSGTKLFIKISNKWHSFSADELGTTTGNVVHYKSGAKTFDGHGTVASPSKILSVNESGKTFFVDIAELTSVFKLPPVKHVGINFKFVLSYASNDEGANDLGIITSSTDDDIVGNVMVAGAVLEIAGVSTVQIDTSAGAATYGDWLSFFSDGSYWYIDGSTRIASSVATNAGHVLA